MGRWGELGRKQQGCEVVLDTKKRDWEVRGKGKGG